MRIAQISPLFESVPPSGYGGTERVVSWLTKELVCAGHITASVFVNNEEPLANLLEVMRHLMSHNGHLKTAIFP